MAAVQEQLDRKVGKEKTTTPKDVNGKKKDWDWFENKLGSNVLTVLLIIAGIVVFYFGVYSPSWKNPSLAEVVNQSRNNWFWVLLFAGILAILIARIAGGATKTLQRFLVGALLFLFIILPVWFWMVGTGTSNAMRSSPRSEIPLANTPVSTWTKIVLQPCGMSERLSVPIGMSMKVIGSRANLHTVYSDGHECVIPLESDKSNPDGPIAGVYITNEAKEINIVSYAFVRQ
jgi:energy-coupling factor transporter transmembrane protein EcfT